MSMRRRRSLTSVLRSRQDKAVATRQTKAAPTRAMAKAATSDDEGERWRGRTQNEMRDQQASRGTVGTRVITQSNAHTRRGGKWATVAWPFDGPDVGYL